MSVFDWSIDRSECPSQYIFNGMTCCRANQPEYAHVQCRNVKDMKCYWTLYEKITRLEQIVEGLVVNNQ